MVHGKTQLIAKELEASKLRYTAAKLAAKYDAPFLVQAICQRMSLRDLAKRVGKSPTYISQIATGKIECSDEVYLAMSERLSTIACGECGGKGVVVDRGHERICGRCGGSGYE